MPYDLSYLVVPVFAGINDSPIEPTASKAGNGAHLISQYNNLLGSVENSLNQTELRLVNLENNPIAPPDKWIMAYNGYNLESPSEKLFLYGEIQGFTEIVIVFYYNPGFNASVRVFNGSTNCNIKILLYGIYQGQTVQHIYVDANTNKEIGFIWVDETVNWISTEPALVRVIT